MCSPSVVCRNGSLCLYEFSVKSPIYEAPTSKRSLCHGPKRGKKPSKFLDRKLNFFSLKSFFLVPWLSSQRLIFKEKNFQACSKKLYFLSRKKNSKPNFFLLLLRTSINNVWVKITPFLSYPTPLKNTRFTRSESNYVADSDFFLFSILQNMTEIFFLSKMKLKWSLDLTIAGQLLGKDQALVPD